MASNTPSFTLISTAPFLPKRNHLTLLQDTVSLQVHVAVDSAPPRFLGVMPTPAVRSQAAATTPTRLDESGGRRQLNGAMCNNIDGAERLIRGHAAHLAEHPRCPAIEVSRYPPHGGPGRPSIHLTAAFNDDGTPIEGIDHGALAEQVAHDTGMEIDPEYTGVFRWTRRGRIIYWWDWRQS